MLLLNSLQRNKNRTDDLQKCIERRLELLNDTVMALRNEVEYNLYGYTLYGHSCSIYRLIFFCYYSYIMIHIGWVKFLQWDHKTYQ